MAKRKPIEYNYNSKSLLLRPYSQTLALNIIELRKRRRIYQKELANQLGVSQQLISHYESGWANPDLLRIVEIASFFDVRPEILFSARSDLLKKYDEF